MHHKQKKPKKTVLLASGVLFILLAGSAGGYAAYDYYAGNHVEIEAVISTAGQPSAGQQSGGSSSGGQPSTGSTSAPSVADQLNGTWKVASPSKVYFSVTTSKETVNFVGDQVQGEWLVDTAKPTNMKGQGEVEIASLSSSNGQRDGHIKGDDYLQASTHPKASFQVTTFEGVPSEWKESQVVPLKMKGKLNVKGIDKEVTFDSNALYEQNQLKLSGSTVVTFDDYGMKNPHTVVLQAENNVTVRLELVLNK